MRFDGSYCTRSALVVTVLVCGLVLVGSVEAIHSPPGANVSIPDYLLLCYDPEGPGLADSPGGSSTLESTLNGVLLLTNRLDGAYWPAELVHVIDTIVRNQTGQQSPYRGGFVLPGSDGPDFKTTALMLETLKALGRMDSVDSEAVERYLFSSFEGSLTLERWLTDGERDTKYWALRTAYAIWNIEVVGL